MNEEALLQLVNDRRREREHEARVERLAAQIRVRRDRAAEARTTTAGLALLFAARRQATL